MCSIKLNLSLIAALAAVSLPVVQSVNPFIISDDRVRSLDISPVLGRGYSIMTNTFQSTCLMVDQTTIPSYNYDYFFTDFTQSTDTESELEGKVSGSLSYGFIKAEVSAESKSSLKTSSKTRVITSTMKIERYYSSVREEVSPLADDAFTMLEKSDYVGFFKACGPNYIRSIRRAQEVTAVFKFKTTSKEAAASFSASLKVQSAFSGDSGGSVTASAKHKSATSSLEIKIQGFGMGLTAEGSETLVATTLDAYKAVMQFSFDSMTKNEDSYNIGMVYGMEVVPWVNNLAFQVAAKMADSIVEIDMARSMIPVAIWNVAGPEVAFANTAELRAKFMCKAGDFAIDMYGYCCDDEHLFRDGLNVQDATSTGNTEVEVPANWYSARTAPQTTVLEACYGKADGSVLGTTKTNPSLCYCKPTVVLDRSLMRDNMSNNGEMVARLDNALRYRLARLGTTEKCISAANAIPEHKYKYYLLNTNDSVEYEKEDVRITLLELKKALDPAGDYGLVSALGRELDEWIEMYYGRCLASIHGFHIGDGPGVDTNYFMAYPWYSHADCMHLSCMANNVRWDPELGGCVPGVATGASAEDYPADELLNANFCAKTEENTCKYTVETNNAFLTNAKTCWDKKNGAIDHIVNNYCLPRLSKDKLTDTEVVALHSDLGTCAPAPARRRLQSAPASAPTPATGDIPLHLFESTRF